MGTGTFIIITLVIFMCTVKTNLLIREPQIFLVLLITFLVSILLSKRKTKRDSRNDVAEAETVAVAVAYIFLIMLIATLVRPLLIAIF